MKNLLSREEFLNMNMNEGFRDTIKKGFNKVKSLFKLGMKKIKNFIAVFNKDGKLMPVITPHALIDHFANVDGVNVFAPKSISDAVEQAGGQGCSNTASYGDEDGIYSYCPKFSSKEEMVDWFESKSYENEPDYKNFVSLPQVIKESMKLEGEELNEDLDKVFKERIKYSEDDDLEGITEITSDEFAEELEDRIFAYTSNDDYKPGNILLFGAPGIGKSTIPRMVCDMYNKDKEAKDKVCLITVDAQTIQPGDLMMPKMPDQKSVLDAIESNGSFEYDTIVSNFGADERQMNALSTMLSKVQQSKSDMVPQQWLPAYKPTGEEKIDLILDDLANGGIHVSGQGKAEKTGNGGLLFFDELLRADPMIFQQTMNLFSPSRTINGWKLGSKWAIMACTNRPADSELVADVWKTMKSDRALEQRFPIKFLVLPEPENWKKWATDYLQADEIILDYIFEDKSMRDGEYPRWHTFLPGDAEASQVNSISPRTWEMAIRAINAYVVKKQRKGENYSSIYDMDKSEIMKCLRGLFDKDFLDDFATWIENHVGTVTIDQIIKNPTKVKSKRNEKTDDTNIIKDIYSQVISAHKDGRTFTDEEIKNIILWFGLNFKDKGNLVDIEFVQHLDKLVEKEEDVETTFPESLQMYVAAWHNDEEIEELKNSDSDFSQMLGGYDNILKLAKEYFPHAVEGDELIPTNDYED